MPIEIKELIVKGTVDELKNKSTTEISKIIQDKISETISNYKILKQDEKRRQQIEKIENERKIKLAFEKQKKEKEE